MEKQTVKWNGIISLSAEQSSQNPRDVTKKPKKIYKTNIQDEFIDRPVVQL